MFNEEPIVIQAHPAITTRVWLLGLFTAGLALPFWWIGWHANRFLVTPRQVVHEEGVLHRRVQVIPLSKVQDVQIETGPALGRVRLTSAGGALGFESIGPLRPDKARAFATAIMKGMQAA